MVFYFEFLDVIMILGFEHLFSTLVKVLVTLSNTPLREVIDASPTLDK